MRQITITATSKTYVIACATVPMVETLPWGTDEFDAFVLIVDPKLLTDELAERISTRLAAMQTQWVECLGPDSEHLHDLVDNASVNVGRQKHIGDGNPMTTWFDDICDAQAMIEYMRPGGQGETDNKLVVVIAGEPECVALAEGLRAITR